MSWLIHLVQVVQSVNGAISVEISFHCTSGGRGKTCSTTASPDLINIEVFFDVFVFGLLGIAVRPYDAAIFIPRLTVRKLRGGRNPSCELLRPVSPTIAKCEAMNIL